MTFPVRSFVRPPITVTLAFYPPHYHVKGVTDTDVTTETVSAICWEYVLLCIT